MNLLFPFGCPSVLAVVWMSWVALGPGVRADDGRLRLGADPGGLRIEVAGDPDDEWHIQTSEDLLTWEALAGIGPLLSGRTNAVSASLGEAGGRPRFYRAQRTGGLYDPSLVRTVALTFSQADWQSRLRTARTTKSNVLATLAINGRTYPAVGVRYKGNTSFEMGGTKKSVNIEVDFVDPDADVMGYGTLNINNAAGDETVMREPLYFTVMRRYAVCPAGNFVKLYINGSYWGLYSFAQQQDKSLIREYFPSTDGDRWRAPNVGGQAAAAAAVSDGAVDVAAGPGGGGGLPPGGGGGGGIPPGGGGGGGGFASGTSALSWLGTNVARYKSAYELKSEESTNAWERLFHVIDVFNNSPAEGFRDRAEEVLAVDRWLWFLAVENVFADDDSYFNKGADYMFYFEPESGRVHPVEHDGNESFAAGDVLLSPVIGAGNTNRPVINRLLAVPELRQRYLAHLRTVLKESFNPTVLNALIDEFSARSKADLVADPKKNYPMAAYTNDLNALKTFVRQRHAYLTNHAELKPMAPTLAAVDGPATLVTAATAPFITARVVPAAGDAIGSVWLYYRSKSYGRFTSVRMFDDGEHGDVWAGDGVYGAAVTNHPAGTKVRYYVEARSAGGVQAASFLPARAEEDTFDYRVSLTAAADTPVVINEFMAANRTTLADPQGEYDDWIELRNLTEAEVDLTGRYLTDEPNNPRKWAFPAGTRIPAGGYLVVWADEDGKAPSGLHASFKLAASGEEILLTDTDARLNAVLDSVSYGAQAEDRSYGRTAADPAVFGVMEPTPGSANR